MDNKAKKAIPIMAVLIIGGIVLYFVNVIFFQKHDTVLSVIVMGAEDSIDADALEEKLRKGLNVAADDQEVNITFLDPGVAANQAVVLTWIRAGTVDLIIADREEFKMAAGGGMCADLEAVLPADLLEKTQNSLQRGAISIYNDDGTLAGSEKECYYGIGLKQSTVFQEWNRSITDPIVSIAINTERTDNCVVGIGVIY
ncbi:MAG: hypothetical protein ACRC3H_07555 [Lachnospiraceae bacterium]